MNWRQEHAKQTANYMQMLAAGKYKNGLELFKQEFTQKSIKALGVSPNPAIRQFKRFAEQHPGECIALANIVGAKTSTELMKYSKEERLRIAKLIKIAKVVVKYFVAPVKIKDFE